MVMYAGRAVEQGATEEVFYDPLMPYTWSLLRSLPRLDTAGEVRLLPIQGTPPSLIFLPSGCNFHTRCPRAQEYCKQHVPPLMRQDADGVAGGGEAFGEAGSNNGHDDHRASCFFPVERGQRIEEPARTDAPYRAGGPTRR
jgi:oligopeptide/dipeptide ABC transporter ATP-binding protein